MPGTVHTDLLANGKIEDPFYRLNEHDLQWIDKVDWEYKTTFSVENELLGKDVVELDFQRVDAGAFAFVFLEAGDPVLAAARGVAEFVEFGGPSVADDAAVAEVGRGFVGEGAGQEVG